MNSRQSERGRIPGLVLIVFIVLFAIALIQVWWFSKEIAENSLGLEDLPPPVSGVLPEVEATEFDGEQLVPIALQGNNAIEGTQYLDRDDYRLEVTGLVENELSLTYDELLELEQFSEATYMPCVEGWGFMAKWTGFKVIDVLDMAGLDEDAIYVVFHGAEGYSTGHFIDYLRDEEIILAYGLNDITLPYDRGFPFQLVARDKYGFKWAKWIIGMEVVDEELMGYWESRGYSNSANVGEPGWTGVISE